MSFKHLTYFTLLLLFSCTTKETQNEPQSFSLQMVMPGTEGDFIEVGLELFQNKARIINGLEEIFVDSLIRNGDSIHFEIPVFDSEMHLSLINEKLSGEWKKYSKSGKDYTLFIRGALASGRNFISDNELKGKWKMEFNAEEGSYPAIGIFDVDKGKVQGTILTETGDYRYLIGASNDGNFKLSTFDGAHAFLFKGEIRGDTLKGIFRSGPSYSCPFKAWKDEGATLASPKSLTFIKEGYNSLQFAFPDLNGDTVRYNSTIQNGKVTIIQILGSWCPNCMDETRFLTELKTKYGDDLEIIGLCFEYSRDFEVASANVRKMAHNLGANYTFLIAGYASKTEAGEKLPMLNKVISYPTSIVVDKAGEISDIHTGFSGPGTGELYTEFTSNFSSMLDDLISD